MSEPVKSPVPVVVAGCGAITKFFYASALTWLEGKPAYNSFGTQLSMIAMNLKNLK